MTRGALLLLCLHLLVGPFVAAGDGECSGDASASDRKKADPLKIAAIFSILASGSLGVSIPLLGRWVPALRPEKDWFFVIKAFAAGVILATGFIHILPDAFGSLTSPCLAPSPWQDFPFAGFGAMVAAIGSLAVDAIATGFLSRRAAAVGDAGTSAEDDVEVHAHGHTHGRVPRGAEAQLIRAGARNRDAFGDNRDIVGRIGVSGDHTAADDVTELPSAVRGHRTGRMHCAGKVEGEVDAENGSVLRSDDSGWDRLRDGDLVGVQGIEPDCADRGGGVELGVGGDLDLHGAGGLARPGFHERESAEQAHAPVALDHCPAFGSRAHVSSCKVGLIVHFLLSFDGKEHAE
ncbi:hypothetical protein ZIOFF_036914 [Zingiber officinale]|uniref:Uncharacterized protein n=1 Tax=Zingiber officinale TaxID=94328 RepID=A0A8J5L8H7_ZINOF|nr:hypothetical protein ZIOFF_036914 [Zingiber officinale]